LFDSSSGIAIATNRPNSPPDNAPNTTPHVKESAARGNTFVRTIGRYPDTNMGLTPDNNPVIPPQIAPIAAGIFVSSWKKIEIPSLMSLSNLN
jgi:hypothetical protein